MTWIDVFEGLIIIGLLVSNVLLIIHVDDLKMDLHFARDRAHHMDEAVDQLHEIAAAAQRRLQAAVERGKA